MIGGNPILWVAFLAWTPPPTDLGACPELAIDPMTYYVAQGQTVTPETVIGPWQCTTVAEAKPEPRKKRYRRRR